MKTATIKDTKQVIFEAYESAVNELKAARTAKFDPIAEKQATKKAETIEKAEAIVSMNILNADIVEKYDALNEAISMKSDELQEYYGIEKEIDSILALIEAKKALEASLDATFNTKREDYNNQLHALQESYAVKTGELRQTREREVEEYKYDLKRSRQIEDDKWADIKAKREAVLRDKEIEHNKSVIELEIREANMETLEAKVAEIPTLISEATQAATIKAKKDAEASHAIEKNVIKRETQLNEKLLENKVEALQAHIDRLEKENESLTVKLENAQARVETIATTAVNAAQPRVITNEK